VLLDQRVSMWTCLMGLSASVVAGSVFGIQYLLVYLFWVLLSRSIVTVLFLFAGHPVSPVYPFVLYYNQIIGSLMKVYALFHMDQQSWTRQKTTLSNGAVNFDAALNRWSSKAMLFSSIAIFFGVISVLLEL
ncbi:glycosyl transferase, partial [Pseudomonas frederiksbergensis]|nr:glycosyl transferase [Pseudomonas frederiksbergensis]